MSPWACGVVFRIDNILPAGCTRVSVIVDKINFNFFYWSLTCRFMGTVKKNIKAMKVAMQSEAFVTSLLRRAAQVELAFTTQTHIQSILKAHSEYLFTTLIIPALYLFLFLQTPFFALSLSKGSWRSSFISRIASGCDGWVSAVREFMANFFTFVFALLIFTSWKIYCARLGRRSHL